MKNLLDLAELAEKAVGIRHVPVLGNQAVLDTEHVHDIKLEFVACWLDAEPLTARVCRRSSAVHEYKVPFGHDPLQGVAKIGHGLESRLKELLEAGLPLRDVGVVLDVIIPHQLIQRT